MRGAFSYVLYVQPISSLKKEAEILVAGQDLYDHYGTLVVRGRREPIIIPAINTDPSTRSKYPALGHGVYRFVRARHRWKTVKETDGFFIMKDSDDFDAEKPWRTLHGSALRQNLPRKITDSRAGVVSYINFHEGGLGLGASDWSDGCFTAPGEYFRQLFRAAPEAPHGYLVYSPSLEEGLAMFKEGK